MDNTSGIMNFRQPADWPLITSFAKSDRSTYKAVRENMPDRKRVQQALDDFLENCLFKNCFPNTGYVNALTEK